MNYYPHHIGDFDIGTKISQLPMVYALATHDLKYVKVGKTASAKQRFINIQSGCPFNLHLWLAIRTPRPSDIEKDIHRNLSHCQTRGEWFSPQSEDLDYLVDYFRGTNEDVRRARDALL